MPTGSNGDIIGSELTKTIEDCDLCSCNFEAPIQSSGEKRTKAGPNLSQPASAAHAVEAAGFDIVSLSNNHICDYDDTGLQQTLDSFSDAVTCTGADTKFESAYTVRSSSSEPSVGFLSLSEGQFGALTEDTLSRGGFAWVNHPSITNIVSSAARSFESLIIQVHAGIEDIELPLPEWRQTYKRLIKCGADAVVAHHPHVPKGWEIYNGKPIFYSLGKFLYDEPGHSKS